jgi:uncharacterized surface protein with fasciclin (FAS1) repeats
MDRLRAGWFAGVLGLGLALLPAGASARSIVAVAADTGTFSILLKAAAAAGLTETLDGSGPYTLFAPTDDAFGKLPKGTLETLLKPESKAKLQQLLTRHVVAGTVLSRDVAGKRMEADSLEGSPLLIDATRVIMVDKARVTRADIKADNGVIHVIDTVLLP